MVAIKTKLNGTTKCHVLRTEKIDLNVNFSALLDSWVIRTFDIECLGIPCLISTNTTLQDQKSGAKKHMSHDSDMSSFG